MLADLTPIVRRGIIDNTRRGSICLQLWCGDDQEPIVVKMEGNCLQDIAGCRVAFRLRSSKRPGTRPHDTLMAMARGLGKSGLPVTAGDMTLSRRYPLPPHGHVANILSIELFQDTIARFIIETNLFEHEISLPEWECDTATANAQMIINMSALHDHVLANVAAFHGPALQQSHSADMPLCRWDHVINRAEAYMLIFPTIRAKYAGYPHAEQAEAFVLDRLDYLNTLADADEHGYEPRGSAPPWEVTDFMEPEHSALAKQAMQHPLFEATVQLSRIIQKHVIAEISQYPDTKEIEALISIYSGVISHVLATIMLAREGQAEVGDISRRVESLCTRMQQLIERGDALHDEARAVYRQGAKAMLAELREFLCTLRQ